MHFSHFKPSAIHKLLLATTALGALSACTPAGLTAGAPSSHTPQSYEPMTSSAAVTSILGGSVTQKDSSAPSPNRTVQAITGTLAHNSGHIEINDGTYLFVDADGVAGGGALADASGAGGTMSVFSYTTHVYDNVREIILSYNASGRNYVTGGVIGIETDAADIPVAGSAHYTGDAHLNSFPTSAGSTTPNLIIKQAVSTVDVDFAAGLVNVDLSNFNGITDGGGAFVSPGAAAFDQMAGTGLVINGAHFTGGNWVTFKNGVAVDMIGATATATSDGTFFGYDPSISAPDEVGGVILIQNATGTLRGTYVAD